MLSNCSYQGSRRAEPIEMTARVTKTTTRKVAKRAPSPSLRSEVPEERIRTRAYEIYLARKDGPGDAVSDWFQAVHELDKKTGDA